MQDGQLGDVFLVATERVGPFPDRVRDVGVVKDLATHDLDLVRWLGGSRRRARRRPDPAPHGPRARGPRPRHRPRSRAASRSTAVVDWLSPTKVRRTRILGERGMLVADTLTADLTFYENGARDHAGLAGDAGHARRRRGRHDALRAAAPRAAAGRAGGVLRARCAATTPPAVVSLEEGLETVAVAEAVLRSAAAGETVVLEAAA